MLSTLFAQSNAGVAAEAVKAWDQVLLFVTQKGFDLALNVLAALAIFVVGRWLARLLTGFSSRFMVRSKVDETLTKFLANIIYVLLLTFVVVAAVGLAIGLALQASLSNFAAGVMLILFKPFKVGNFVDAGGSKGIVEEIRIFNTLMRTGDNVEIIVPNAKITGGTITNFSAKDTRRIDLVIGCGYDDDLRAVRQFFDELIADDERILTDPEPVIAVNELGASSVDFVVRPWVKSSDYWAVRCDLIEKIKLGFDEKGFSIPFPQQDVHLHGTA